MGGAIIRINIESKVAKPCENKGRRSLDMIFEAYGIDVTRTFH